MARIRSIKPEFPHSESMGKVSRDARLTFVLMWTLADDEGRLRGNSRMLASLLYPYDDDAPKLIEGWLVELETQHCIVRYEVSGSSFVQICNWLNHQKIDKPSKSKIPTFDESSRILANPRERSSGDRRIVSEDQGSKDHQSTQSATGADDLAEKPKQKRGTRIEIPFPVTADMLEWAAANTPNVDVKAATAEFEDYWRAVPGAKGTKLDWESTWRNRLREVGSRAKRSASPPKEPTQPIRMFPRSA